MDFFLQLSDMDQENVVLQYKGFFNYNLLNKLLGVLANYIDENDVDVYYYKKIQIIMVEMLENNYQYTQTIHHEILGQDYLPDFKILKTDDGFMLRSSNIVKQNDAYLLKAHIDKINSSNLQQLKDLYKDILKEGIYSEKRSAGIGLIRIAKVTKNKIEYSFRQIDNKLLYYTLEILINSK